jgi:adenine-specific DNA-methyltransferase
MQLNAEDGGNRKFIMVQIPQETDKDSEAYKAGYKNICEIGKERIRRAGKKIIEENKGKEGIENLDAGFRVYRLDSSNMKDVFYHPTEVRQDRLFEMESNIKDDRTPEDILAQVMLDLGLTLDLPIETRMIAGSTVFLVAGNSLVACFDEEVDFSIVDELA